MQKMKLSLVMLLLALTFPMGTVQLGYAMSFGKHNNGGGSTNQGSNQLQTPSWVPWTRNPISSQFPNQPLSFCSPLA